MPLYVTVVGSLLFLAFAYFAVGQAVANRSDAQGAADAAALAAAVEAREQIGKNLLDAIEDPEAWEDLLEALVFPNGPPCERAQVFAAKNGASAEACERASLPRKGFNVHVKNTRSVGSSIIPGTESVRSSADATAVVEPLCELAKPAKGEGAEIELKCQGERLVVDPEATDPLPSLEELFKVRLVK